MELVDHVHHVLDDHFVVVFFVTDVVEERLVELDDVDIQVLDGGESGVACTKVIDRDGNTMLAESVHELLHGDFVFKIGGFRELNFDKLAIDIVFLHDGKDIFSQVRVAEVVP